MTYKLFIGNRLYFSWSLSAYLMFERFGLGDTVDTTVFRPASEADLRPMMVEHAPARTLPTVFTPEGAVLNDSFAIAEELATRHPDIPFWPADPLARGTARAVAAEMHSSFGHLRGNWPFALRHVYEPQTPDAKTQAELDRLEAIWSHARKVTGAQGPWLCGEYSLADAIFAPMAIRLAIYGFDTAPTTKAYVAAHMSDPAFLKWREMALTSEEMLPKFELDFPRLDWPSVYEA